MTDETGKPDASRKARTAIALSYDHDAGEAPKVVAKGEGAVAARIIETAQAHDVHVEENPALAAALSRVELDDTIPKDLYTAVAAVISFVLQQTRKT